MSKVAPIQNNFNGGEVSPLVYGRPDLDKYSTGLKTCLNFIPLLQGPAERRPGTVFVKEVKTSSAKTRIVRFEFSTQQAYILEFGNLYVRFYKDNGAIIGSTSTISGATAANPVVVTDTAHPYSNGDEIYITGVVGMTELNGRYFLVSNQSTNSYELQDIDGVDINGTGYTAYTSGGTAAPTIELTTTYATADLFNLQFSQSADVLYITHPSYPPRKIERASDTSWSITDISFLDGPYFNTNATDTTLTLSGTTGSVTVTASAVTGINNDTGFQTTDVGRLLRFEDPAGNWTWLEITARASTTSVTATIFGPDASAGTATTTWRIGIWSETTGYPATSTFHQNRLAFGGATDTPQRVDLSVTGDFENFEPTQADGTVVDDGAATTTLSADTVNAIRWMADDEKGLVIGTVGGEWVVRPDDNGGRLTPSNIQGTRSSAFGSANIKPARVGRAIIFVQSSLKKIRELAYVFEDDGFRAPDMTLIAQHITQSGVVEMAYQSEPQSVVWMCLVDGTLVGMTYDRDQQVLGFHKHTLGGFSDQYDTTAAKVESVASIPNTTGSADELYVVVNRYINGATRRYIEYMKPFWDDGNDQEDAFFVDSGLTLDSPTTISAITKASPGVVTATSHPFSDGDIVRITSVTGMTEVNGNVYKVANSTANTFELNTRDDVAVDTSAFTTYQTGGQVRQRVTSISGLEHLEGETVTILGEGAALGTATVSSGAITVSETSKAQVGLMYNSDLQTLRYDVGARNGTAQGKLQRIHRLITRFYQTLGGKVGQSFSDLNPLIFRKGGDDMDTAVPLFDGDVEIEWDADYSTESLICIRQDQPLPMTVQSLMPQLDTQDRQ